MGAEEVEVEREGEENEDDDDAPTEPPRERPWGENNDDDDDDEGEDESVDKGGKEREKVARHRKKSRSHSQSEDKSQENKGHRNDKLNAMKESTGSFGKSLRDRGMSFAQKGDNFLIEKLKEQLPLLLKVGFALERSIFVVAKYGRKVNRLYLEFEKKFEKYDPDLIIEMVTGFLLMFFGGFYITTVAAIEAFRQGGSEKLFKHIRKLHEQVKAIREANEEDDALDEDEDGIPDVDQISKQELIHRKFMVIVRAADPEVLAEAFSTLYSCVLAVIATLRIRFARTISLGAVIGEKLYKPVERLMLPTLREFTDEELHKWYPTVFGYVCRFIGITIAFHITRILRTVHTAVRGGHMLIEGSEKFTKKHGMEYLTKGSLDDMLIWLLVWVGIYFQIFIFTTLPLPIKLILLPFTITEWVLQTLVTSVPTS